MFQNEHLVTMTPAQIARREFLLSAVLRFISPDSQSPILFSQVGFFFKDIASNSGGFVEVMGVRPAEFAKLYGEFRGVKLKFSWDDRTPPLLYCSRREGPWTPIPDVAAEGSHALSAWLKEQPLDLDEVDFVAGMKCFDDAHAVAFAWLRHCIRSLPQSPRGSYPDRVNSVARNAVRSDNCVVGAKYEGVIQRLSLNGRGAIIRFTDAQVAGETGYLPLATLQEGKKPEQLLQRTGVFRIVDSRGSSLLLELVEFHASSPDSDSINKVATDVPTPSETFPLESASDSMEHLRHLANEMTADVQKLSQLLKVFQETGQTLTTPGVDTLLQSRLRAILDTANVASKELELSREKAELSSIR
jgi:hypothetical protein